MLVQSTFWTTPIFKAIIRNLQLESLDDNNTNLLKQLLSSKLAPSHMLQFVTKTTQNGITTLGCITNKFQILQYLALLAKYSCTHSVVLKKLYYQDAKRTHMYNEQFDYFSDFLKNAVFDGENSNSNSTCLLKLATTRSIDRTDTYQTVKMRLKTLQKTFIFFFISLRNIFSNAVFL